MAGLLLLATLLQAQRGFRGYREEEDVPIPPDAGEKSEYYFARLQYQNSRSGYRGYGRGSWTTDYPKADRQFLQGVRRLSRLHTRSMEQVVNMESEDIFNYPWVYAVEVGHWELNNAHAKRLRDFLLRGGFLMVDDFHGTYEWEVFMASMSKVFPERAVVDLDSKEAIFHVLYDLDDKFQVPGIQYWRSGRTYEQDGIQDKWRGIFDDKGRIMVAICHNMDLGDAWEWADHPNYPEKYASMSYRIGLNYIIYAMSH
ncbi:MAG: DUF4159 domain-containing protein [Candidatus Solibacter usitatus]|nr:DUF4159 domain-containing protein [Candidatus Solibacter usitatus]